MTATFCWRHDHGQANVMIAKRLTCISYLDMHRYYTRMDPLQYFGLRIYLHQWDPDHYTYGIEFFDHRHMSRYTTKAATHSTQDLRTNSKVLCYLIDNVTSSRVNKISLKKTKTFLRVEITLTTHTDKIIQEEVMQLYFRYFYIVPLSQESGYVIHTFFLLVLVFVQWAWILEAML